MATKRKPICVVDAVTGCTFCFRNHGDKEKFFDVWDKLVIKVR